jgi:hypothetical protein
VTGVCSASAAVVSLLHEGIGQWCRRALGSSETSAVHRFVEKGKTVFFQIRKHTIKTVFLKRPLGAIVDDLDGVLVYFIQT